VLTVVGVAMLVALGLGTRALVSEAATAVIPTRGELCAQYDLFVAQVDEGGVFGTQASVQAARKLSVMAARYDQPTDDASLADGNPPVAQAGDDINTVLRSVAWEQRDLLTATRPVALECGWDWPVTTTPPPAAPQPPAS
jgi:hypothetical protein